MYLLSKVEPFQLRGGPENVSLCFMMRHMWKFLAGTTLYLRLGFTAWD